MTKPAYRIENVATALRCDPEQDEIISALAERHYRIFEVEQPAGALVPYHAHDDEEVVIVLTGAINFIVEEEIVTVEEGEVITIREGAVHAAAPLYDRPSKLLIAFAGQVGEEEEPEDFEGGDEDDHIGYA